jgi:hypothetical protein
MNGAVIGDKAYEPSPDPLKIEMREVDLSSVPDAPHHSMEHFRNVLHGVEALNPTAEQAWTVLNVVGKIYESARTGQMLYF